MPLIKLPTRPDKSDDIAIAKKAKKSVKSTPSVKGGGGIATRIANIKATVLAKLGKYAEETLLIQDAQELHDYISTAIEVGYISIDTETTGLDPLTDECVGISLHTKRQKPCYIPINHVSYITGEKCNGQLPKEIIAEELQRLTDTKIIMFNAAFDIRVIKNQIGVRLHCYWDCSLASRLLNENEAKGEGGLKKLHKKYVLNNQEDAFKFDDLFKGITFNLIPISVGYLYATHDAILTTELYEFQQQYLYYEPDCTFDDRNGMNGVAYTFFHIEMPCVDAVVDMEDTGVALDVGYARELSVKYHRMESEALQKFYDILSEYSDKIDGYVSTHNGCKLDNPINISSPSQLAILFYDILEVGVIDKKTPRGTGEAILGKIGTPLAQAILDYRGIEKLISTYIDKLPDCLNPTDNRLHCKFNQYGTDTGRFSSSDPNLQNIPSHNKDIRPMFTATLGYVMMSADYSQQEPKCLAALCRRDGDSQMYDTFMQGKDLYSEIASKAFNKTYEECKEFNPDGSTNKEGKERRTQAKSILLGVLYGRGTASIGEQLRCSTDKAEAIKNSVFRGFPAIKEFEERSLQMAKENGYVTTVCGRKRRLPDLQLPEYEMKWQKGFEPDGDILDFDDLDVEVPYKKQAYYISKLKSARGFKKRDAVKAEAQKEHIEIIDNNSKIAEATRQCVNARVQGSAADLTKLAMIELYNNERLRELGFRMLIPVHDEIIAECPRENLKECAELLASTMSHAAEEILEMPIKVDVECTTAWYGEKVEV